MDSQGCMVVACLDHIDLKFYRRALHKNIEREVKFQSLTIYFFLLNNSLQRKSLYIYIKFKVDPSVTNIACYEGLTFFHFNFYL